MRMNFGSISHQLRGFQQEYKRSTCYIAKEHDDWKKNSSSLRMHIHLRNPRFSHDLSFALSRPKPLFLNVGKLLITRDLNQLAKQSFAISCEYTR